MIKKYVTSWFRTKFEIAALVLSILVLDNFKNQDLSTFCQFSQHQASKISECRTKIIERSMMRQKWLA